MTGVTGAVRSYAANASAEEKEKKYGQQVLVPCNALRTSVVSASCAGGEGTVATSGLTWLVCVCVLVYRYGAQPLGPVGPLF